MYIHNRSRATASLRALLYQDRLKFSSDFGSGGGTSGRATAIGPRGLGSNPGSNSQSILAGYWAFVNKAGI